MHRIDKYVIYYAFQLNPIPCSCHCDYQTVTLNCWLWQTCQNTNLLYTKHLHDDYLCVKFSHCLLSVSWQVIYISCFLSSIFYLPVSVPSLCLIIIDNTSTYSDSFNYSKYMHCSIQKPSWFSISAIPPFFPPLSNIIM